MNTVGDLIHIKDPQKIENLKNIKDPQKISQY